jgi:UDP-sugar transporter A1/2/3
MLLLVAALLLCVGESSSSTNSPKGQGEAIFMGVIPVLVASVISGLASTLCQWASQVCKDLILA